MRYADSATTHRRGDDRLSLGFKQSGALSVPGIGAVSGSNEDTGIEYEHGLVATESVCEQLIDAAGDARLGLPGCNECECRRGRPCRIKSGGERLGEVGDHLIWVSA
jgi:hypothetical protein